MTAVGITADWNAVVTVAGRGDGDARRAEAFWRERAHLFLRGNSDWPSYKILLQIAVEHGDDSAMSRKADAWIAAGRCNWPWLRRRNRPAHAKQRSGLRFLEAERKQIVFGALLLPDARIMSWWSDYTLRCFDCGTEAPGLVLSGHSDLVWGAQAMSDGRVLSWSSDGTLRLWDSVTGQPGPVLSGHGARVAGALVMSNGRILSWSDDETLRLWDATTGEPGPVLTGHADSVSGALIMPDGRILSWSNDMTLRLWDGLTGEPGPVLSGHTDGVEGALVMADGRILSWTGKAGTKMFGEAILRLWDGVTGKEGPVLSGHADTVFSALVMPDPPVMLDRRILSWSRDTTLRLATIYYEKRAQRIDHLRSALQGLFGARSSVLSGHTAGVFGALVTPDGRILSWSWDKTLRLWDGRTGEAGPVLRGHTEVVTGALVMPDGQILSWSKDNTLRLWHGTTGEAGPMNLVKRPFGSSGVDGALAMPDGRVLSWSGDESLQLWEPEAEPSSSLRKDDQISELSDERKSRLRQRPTTPDEWQIYLDELQIQEDEWQAEREEWQANEVFVLPDGRFGLPRRYSLELYDGASEKPDLVLTGHVGEVRGILAVPDGRLLSWSSDKTFRLWDGTTGAPGPVLRGHTDSVLGAFLMPDLRILSWSEDNTLRLWDGTTGTPRAAISWPAGICGALPMPDGSILSWSKDYTLHLWNGETLQPGPVLPGPSRSKVADGGVLVMPTGRILRWLDGFDKMRVWNGTSNNKGILLAGHEGGVNGALLMPDGRILSWSEDNTLRLWDGETGAAGPVLQGHTDEVEGALVVRDGRILSWSKGGTLRLWDGETGGGTDFVAWLRLRRKCFRYAGRSDPFTIGRRNRPAVALADLQWSLASRTILSRDRYRAARRRILVGLSRYRWRSYRVYVGRADLLASRGRSHPLHRPTVNGVHMTQPALPSLAKIDHGLHFFHRSHDVWYDSAYKESLVFTCFEASIGPLTRHARSRVLDHLRGLQNRREQSEDANPPIMLNELIALRRPSPTVAIRARVLTNQPTAWPYVHVRSMLRLCFETKAAHYAHDEDDILRQKNYLRLFRKLCP